MRARDEIRASGKACRLVATTGFIVLLVSSCASSDRALSWEVVFAEDVDPVRAAHVEARILEGGCASALEAYSAIVDGASTGPEPGALRPGVYGFDAVVVDSECIVFAAGCEERRLPQPSGEKVTVVLERATTPARRCAPAQCAAGVCGESLFDGGGADGADALDAGTCTEADLVAQTACAEGFHCGLSRTADGGASHDCYRDGTGVQADVCTGNSSCAVGFGCLRLRAGTAQPSICARYCRDASDCPTARGTICTADPGQVGVCTTDCDPTAAGICPIGAKCALYDYEGHTLCIAEGTVEEGDRCESSVDCVTGVGCFDDGGGRGQCARYCVPKMADCPTGQTCIALPPAEVHGVCF